MNHFKTHPKKESQFVKRALNLGRIFKAMLTYASEPSNNNLFPSGGRNSTEALWLLHPRYEDDYRIFYGPWDDRPKPTPSEGWSATKDGRLTGPVPQQYLDATGYTYLEGSGLDSPAATIVAYGQTPTDGRRNVLYASGSVKALGEEESAKKIAANPKPPRGRGVRAPGKPE